MGIRKLQKMLGEYDNTVSVYKSLNDYVLHIRKSNNSPIVICIDAYLYLHKYLYSTTNYINAFKEQIDRFKMKSIIPVYVFDGLPPTEKKNVILNRLGKKQKKREAITELEIKLNNMILKGDVNGMNIIKDKINKLKKQTLVVTKDHITKLKDMFNRNNTIYITAKGEADSLCAKLSKLDLVYACLTDDMDMLAHGCKRIIRMIKSEIYEYELDNILDVLYGKELEKNIKMEKFIRLCALLGCDYSRTLPRIKQEEYKKLQQLTMKSLNPYRLVYELSNRFETFEDIMNTLEVERRNKLEGEYRNAMNIFKTASDREEMDMVIVNKIITIKENYKPVIYNKMIMINKISNNRYIKNNYIY